MDLNEFWRINGVIVTCFNYYPVILKEILIKIMKTL